MTILGKLNTLLRAGAREGVECITDANAIRIYRQEIYDAQCLLQRRRAGLAALIATRKDLEKEIVIFEEQIKAREAQIVAIPARERPDDILALAAEEIASNEANRDKLEARQRKVVERIHKEELALRRLAAKIKEHNRELNILSAEIAHSGRLGSRFESNTIAAALNKLRDTHEGIVGSVVAGDTAEDSYLEASDRVDGDPLEQAFAAHGRDPASMRIAQVVERLKTLE